MHGGGGVHPCTSLSTCIPQTNPSIPVLVEMCEEGPQLCKKTNEAEVKTRVSQHAAVGLH